MDTGLKTSGGGRSLALTFLRTNSLLTGKNTGFFVILPSKNALRFSKLQILWEKWSVGAEIRAGNYQEDNREAAGNLFALSGNELQLDFVRKNRPSADCEFRQVQEQETIGDAVIVLGWRGENRVPDVARSNSGASPW
jgi:hypothetical protein